MMIDYVGECLICNEIVDESDAGYCKECGQPFHWGTCGTWGDWEEGIEHLCNDCLDES